MLLRGPLIFCWQALQPFCASVGCSHTTCNSFTWGAYSSINCDVPRSSRGFYRTRVGDCGAALASFQELHFLPSTPRTGRLFIFLGVTFNIYTLSVYIWRQKCPLKYILLRGLLWTRLDLTFLLSPQGHPNFCHCAFFFFWQNLTSSRGGQSHWRRLSLPQKYDSLN